jgi:hypothetical protein
LLIDFIVWLGDLLAKFFKLKIGSF